MATIKQISDALRLPGETLGEFTTQWRELPEQDKQDLKALV